MCLTLTPSSVSLIFLSFTSFSSTRNSIVSKQLDWPASVRVGIVGWADILVFRSVWGINFIVANIGFWIVELILCLGSFFAILPPNIDDNFAPDSNELTGSIPEDWGGMRNLEQLFLSGNNLRGKIPETIRGMEALQYFRASDNQFSGTIPTDMGKMLKMEFLYMEENDFDGAIPSQLGELHKLQVSRMTYSLIMSVKPSFIDLH